MHNVNLIFYKLKSDNEERRQIDVSNTNPWHLPAKQLDNWSAGIAWHGQVIRFAWLD